MDGSRISGKGFNEIIWSQFGLSVRPSYFIFIGYLKKQGVVQVNPLNPTESANAFKCHKKVVTPDI